ncbi:MAG: hypothetical protein OXU79_14085 [Gemmatimonadota bacterium]|nr:hypothetical protein [Gemmatimonadota bacterium]
MSRIATCVVFLLCLGLYPAGPAKAQNVGDAVPAFSLTGLDGRTYAPANYEGSVLALYYLGHN